VTSPSTCRLAGWFVALLVTIGLFQLVAGLHPRSIPWIVASLVLAGLVGAALLSLFEWLCTRRDKGS